MGAARAWDAYPEWMDYLRPDSPNHRQKLLERACYLRFWAAEIRPGSRVLDLGGGIGRFATWCLDLGCEVELVDLDERALAAARAHAAGRPGRLRTHHAGVERLPELAPVDTVIAAEILCYVADPAVVLAGARRLLRRGGALLASVEGRWGWAAAADAPAGQLGALLGTGIVSVPGDRFVHTYTSEGFRELLAGWEVEQLVPSHYLFGGPFEGVAGEIDEIALFAAEDRFRAHPELSPLGRALLAVAR